MINDVLQQCDFPTSRKPLPILDYAGGDSEHKLIDDALACLEEKDSRVLGRLISIAENEPELADVLRGKLKPLVKAVPVLGITGTGGSGKSSLIDELVRRFLLHYQDSQHELFFYF